MRSELKESLAPEVWTELEALRATLNTEALARFDESLALAFRVHREAMRDEGTPYIGHPVRVALILADTLPCPSLELLCAALLHDTLEDGDIQVADLDRFGPLVGEMVAAVTRPWGSDKVTHLLGLGEAARDVRLLKMADRLDNLRSVSRSPEPGKPARYAAETRKAILGWARDTHAELAAKLSAALTELDGQL